MIRKRALTKKVRFFSDLRIVGISEHSWWVPVLAFPPLLCGIFVLSSVQRRLYYALNCLMSHDVKKFLIGSSLALPTMSLLQLSFITTGPISVLSYLACGCYCPLPRRPLSKVTWELPKVHCNIEECGMFPTVQNIQMQPHTRTKCYCFCLHAIGTSGKQWIVEESGGYRFRHCSVTSGVWWSLLLTYEYWPPKGLHGVWSGTTISHPENGSTSVPNLKRSVKD